MKEVQLKRRGKMCNSNMFRTLPLDCSPPPAAMNTSPRSYATSTGSRVKYRIDFKILRTTYKALNNLAPPYLSDLLPLHAPTRCLRSTGANTLKTIRTKCLTWGDRALSVAAPSLWNTLPIHIRQAPTLSLSKQALKTPAPFQTHLFKLAFTC